MLGLILPDIGGRKLGFLSRGAGLRLRLCLRGGGSVGRGGLIRALRLLAILAVLLSSAHARAVEMTDADIENKRCFNCHGQSRITDLAPSEWRTMVSDPGSMDARARVAEPRPGLFTPPDALHDGPHADLTCIRCHEDADELPHTALLKQARCDNGCHAPAAAAYRNGIHAEALADADDRAPGCADCHGGHDIRVKTDRRSRMYPLNVNALCADCHKQHNGLTTNGQNKKQYVDSYMQSVHGQAVSGAGLIVAATCVDCHRGHDVQPSNDENASTHRMQIPDTCGRCHEGIKEVYTRSIHGQTLLEDDSGAPVCTDCHTAHSITHASTDTFNRDIVGECGQCHDKPSDNGGLSLYETYRRSYHGQVTELGSYRAARCSDCHGTHDIRPIADPVSRLHLNNRVQTCAACHKSANANFVQFMPHADFHDGQRYPLLHGVWLYFIILMTVTFVFYGVHSLLWLIRSLIERRRHTTRKARVHPQAQGYAIKRFRKTNRVNHALVAFTFFGLTLTGMPLLFSDQGWAKVLAGALGGVDNAGVWHRFFAVILGINFVIHFTGMYKRFRRQSAKLLLVGPYTLLPRMKDVYDCLGMFRWFFTGRGKPAFDRWTYWEKFDYWAEIIGTLIIGGTGLMLWFPGLFSLLIPGWGFNVASVIHGYEAMLAVGFIFTIHFFNANLRPEKFPVDDVIFTGVVSEDELRHERPAEYHRLKQTGELSAMRVPAPPRWQRTAAIVVGVTAMAIGMSMVALIILAGLRLI